MKRIYEEKTNIFYHIGRDSSKKAILSAEIFTKSESVYKNGSISGHNRVTVARDPLSKIEVVLDSTFEPKPEPRPVTEADLLRSEISKLKFSLEHHRQYEQQLIKHGVLQAGTAAVYAQTKLGRRLQTQLDQAIEQLRDGDKDAIKQVKSLRAEIKENEQKWFESFLFESNNPWETSLTFWVPKASPGM